MIALFKDTFKLNMAILTNSIIYRLRKLPLVKHLVPGELYGNEGINAFVIILSVIFTLLSSLFSLTIYLIGVVLLALVLQEKAVSDSLLFLFFFITLFSSIHYNRSFYASKEKYYAVVLMRIDANKYAMMDLTYRLCSKAILSIIILAITSIFVSFPFYYGIIYAVYYLTMNIIGTYGIALIYKKTKRILTDKYIYSVISMVLMLICIVFMQIAMNQNWFVIPQIVYIIIAIALLPISYHCYKKLEQSRVFVSIYKKKLTLESVMLDVNVATTSIKKNMAKGITNDVSIDHSKHGFDFFNDAFFRRHKRILFDSAARFSLGFALLFGVSCVILLMVPEGKENISLMIQNNMPWILMAMYFTNRGAKVTLAMFVNCDASMLNYRFYRQPKVILSLFSQRLKTVILVNMMPSLVISIGLIAMLIVSTNNFEAIDALLIFISVNAVSVFFSVHHLILYYLLQPYDISLQARGFLFNTISTLTYIVCYNFMDVEIPLFPFTIAIIIFSVIYIIVSLVLVYRLAPKTFKIKV